MVVYCVTCQQDFVRDDSQLWNFGICSDACRMRPVEYSCLRGDVRPIDAIKVLAPNTCNFSVALCEAVEKDLRRDPFFRAMLEDRTIGDCGIGIKRDFFMSLDDKPLNVNLFSRLKYLVREKFEFFLRVKLVEPGDYPLVSQYFDYNGTCRIDELVEFIEGLRSGTLEAVQDMVLWENENVESYHLVKPRTPSPTINPMPGPLIMGTMETFETTIVRYGRRVSFSFGMSTEETCVYRDTCLMDVNAVCTTRASVGHGGTSVIPEPPPVYEPMDLSEEFDLPSDIEEQVQREEEELSDDFWGTGFYNKIILEFYPKHDGAVISFIPGQRLYDVDECSVVYDVTDLSYKFPRHVLKPWNNFLFTSLTFDSSESKNLHVKRWIKIEDVIRSFKDIMFHNAIVKRFVPTAWQCTAYNLHKSGVLCIGNIVVAEVTEFYQNLQMGLEEDVVLDKIEWMDRIFVKIEFKNCSQATKFISWADMFCIQANAKEFYGTYMPQLVADALNIKNKNVTKTLPNVKHWLNLEYTRNDMNTKIEFDLAVAPEPMRKRVKAN
jgi:hypothetical protein